jgi:hypothetical protein
MKRLVAAVLVVVAVGCERPESDRVAFTVGERPAESHGWLVEAVEVAQVRKGVIAQHTLYPYQFVADGAALNELGQRDLAILAEHYSVFPGPLNVRRGGASEDLYTQRIDTVVRAMGRAGVDTNRIQITSGMAGGDGSPSDRIVLVMQQSQKQAGGENSASGISLIGVATEPQQ